MLTYKLPPLIITWLVQINKTNGQKSLLIYYNNHGYITAYTIYIKADPKQGDKLAPIKHGYIENDIPALMIKTSLTISQEKRLSLA